MSQKDMGDDKMVIEDYNEDDVIPLLTKKSEESSTLLTKKSEGNFFLKEKSRKSKNSGGTPGIKSIPCRYFDKSRHMVFEKKRISNEAIIVEKFDAQSGPFFGDNKVLFQINKGSVVEVLEEKNNWSEIILIDGKKGWVLSKALRKM